MAICWQSTGRPWSTTVSPVVLHGLRLALGCELFWIIEEMGKALKETGILWLLWESKKIP